MKRIIVFTILASLTSVVGCAQKSETSVNGPEPGEISVGGRCEGCEAIYEGSVPFSKLNERDTFPGFDGEGRKIEISGRVFKSDGRTPAAGIVIYLYHTNQQGIYPTNGNEKGWGTRHGYLRSWLKTDANGNYSFYTIRPGSYPNSRALAHIHATVKEPGKSAYYIEDYFFADDPFLAETRMNNRPRGGNGVVNLVEGSDGIWKARRDITLGLNIAGY